MRNTERYYEEKATYRMENYNSVDYIVQVTMDIDFEEARMWGDDETLLAECKEILMKHLVVNQAERITEVEPWHMIETGKT